MKHFLLSALLAAATISLTVQRTTSYASEKSYPMEASPRDMAERNLVIKKPFTSVDVKTGVNLCYTVGTSNTVRIVGPEVLVEQTVVTVEDGTLKVYLQPDQLSSTRVITNLTVYVTAPAFSRAKMGVGASINMTTEMAIQGDLAIKGSSGANFKCDKGLKCATLDVDISSGATVDIYGLKAKESNIHASSGAIVTLKGAVNTLDANISSGAVANLTELSTKEGDLHASSGAVAHITELIGKTCSISVSSGAVVNAKKSNQPS